MHNAPSVNYPVGRSRFEGAMLLALWLMGALAAGATLWWGQAPGWRIGLLVSTSLGCGAVALVCWYYFLSGNLRWDGKDWTLLGGTKACAKALPIRQVSVVLDFQHWLLLRIEPWHGDGNWRTWPRLLWLERRLALCDWDDLRRAVYSRARIDALREPEERLRDTPLP